MFGYRYSLIVLIIVCYQAIPLKADDPGSISKYILSIIDCERMIVFFFFPLIIIFILKINFILARTSVLLNLNISECQSQYHIGFLSFTFSVNDLKIQGNEQSDFVKLLITNVQLLVLQGT